jgi:hypothetical protein
MREFDLISADITLAVDASNNDRVVNERICASDCCPSPLRGGMCNVGGSVVAFVSPV